jgi:hypothetical protein
MLIRRFPFNPGNIPYPRRSGRDRWPRSRRRRARHRKYCPPKSGCRMPSFSAAARYRLARAGESSFAARLSSMFRTCSEQGGRVVVSADVCIERCESLPDSRKILPAQVQSGESGLADTYTTRVADEVAARAGHMRRSPPRHYLCPACLALPRLEPAAAVFG